MINQNLKFNTAIDINGSVSDVWNALVNPEKIKIYLFGTEAVSDWKKGSDLIFRGEWEGTEYKDSATILEIEPEKTLKYNYISSFSQLEDKTENRSTLTFTITKKDHQPDLLFYRKALRMRKLYSTLRKTGRQF